MIFAYFFVPIQALICFKDVHTEVYTFKSTILWIDIGVAVHG